MEKITVLVAAMNETDFSLVEKMNIQTDALVGNQCDRHSRDDFETDGRKITYFNTKERGVGLNRNTTLLRAPEGIVLFADDDMVYQDGYESMIRKAYEELPDADGIIFNIEMSGSQMGRRQNSKIKRVRFYNALNYGAARLSARTTALKREHITFSTCFGGGTMYSSGEDTLFIVDMLKHGMKLYTYPAVIATVDQTTSTWFKGYTPRYYHDKGALYRAISKKGALLLGLQALIRHREYKESGLTFREALGQVRRGIKAYDTLSPYKEASDQSNNM